MSSDYTKDHTGPDGKPGKAYYIYLLCDGSLVKFHE